LNNRKFHARLAKSLPDWVARGWIQSDQQQVILDYVASQHRATPWLTYAFSILGVLLLGSGVITYFAANWGDMPKLMKLLILFGSMWLAYGAAWHALRDEHAPLLGQALLLFGTIMFGANIMLIAQIYHIDSHFPNGILLWSVGALVGAYLIRSQPMLAAAIVLGWLWTTLEIDAFWYRHGIHWPFLLLWLAFLPLIYRHRFRASLHLALIALLIWSVYNFTAYGGFWRNTSRLYLIQDYFLIYLSVFLLGMIFATYERLAFFATTLQRYGVFALMVSAYALTSPYLQTSKSLFWHYRTSLRASAETGFLVSTFIALALVVALSLWHRLRSSGSTRPAYLKWGEWLIGAITLLILVNLFVGGGHGSAMAIAFNLLYFTGLVWLIFAGMNTEDRFFINIGFVFFGITLLSRYFDTFWTLLNRSYFFMLGGVVLIAGGYILERKRRQLTHALASRREGGEA